MSLLFSPLWSDSSWSLLIVVASGDGEGVKISWAIWVPKVGSSAPCGELALVTSSVLGAKSGLVDEYLIYSFYLHVLIRF